MEGGREGGAEYFSQIALAVLRQLSLVRIPYLSALSVVSVSPGVPFRSTAYHKYQLN